MSRRASTPESAPPSPTPGIQTIIVSGLSGSGKSTAIRALEDVGYFCVDNLPVVLLQRFLVLLERASIERAAVVIDIRERAFLAEYERMIGRLREGGYELQTLFLTCREDVLIRRYKETRRRHPLQEDGAIADGLAREHEALDAVHAHASEVIDTSDMTVHDLRRMVTERFSLTGSQPFQVRLVSFGFKHGLPHEADYVFDVRFLPNPYFVPELRPLTGLDPAVQEHVLTPEESQDLLTRLEDLLQFVTPRARREGKSQLTFAIGCTGGQHRSVAIVEHLARSLQGMSQRTSVLHRDLDQG